MGNKEYKAGEPVNLRLSKRRVTRKMMKAVNKASSEGRLNQYVLDAIEFYAGFEEFKGKELPEAPEVAIKYFNKIFRAEKKNSKVETVIDNDTEFKAFEKDNKRVLPAPEVIPHDAPEEVRRATIAVIEDDEDDAGDEIFERTYNKGMKGAFSKFRTR